VQDNLKRKRDRYTAIVAGYSNKVLEIPSFSIDPNIAVITVEYKLGPAEHSDGSTITPTISDYPVTARSSGALAFCAPLAVVTTLILLALLF
jgi:hypothetical protein